MAEFDDMKFTFLYIDLYKMGEQWTYPESRIPYNMLRYIVKGKAEFVINGERIIVKKNDIVYIPNGCMMSCKALTESFEFYSVRFISSLFYASDDILAKYYGIPRITEAEGEGEFFKGMYQWVKTEHIAKKCFIRGYLYLLIGRLSARGARGEVDVTDEEIGTYDLQKLAYREQKCNKTDPRIRIVADYIVLHPDERFTPEKMAQMVGLSKQRFSSLFKKCMGKAPMEYTRELKLSIAARKLLVSTENVSDIAYEVGYEDPNYFIREFKRAFGDTPNRYREKAKEL